MGKLILIAILGVLASSAGETPVAGSRTCPGRMLDPPCAEVWRFDAVFVGTAIRVTTVPFSQPSEYHYQEFQKLTAALKVQEPFRGDIQKEVTFEMGDCYFPFKEGETYLVYAHKGQDGRLILHRGYTRTRLVSEAAEDLAYLRGLSTAPEGGRMFGKILDHRERVTLRIHDEPYYSSSLMSGIKVTARSGDQTYYAITDGTGFYEFLNLPEGDYSLQVDVPSYLSGSSEKAKVHNKGCAPTRFSIQAMGVIAGRVVDSRGQPLTNAVVTIFSAEGVTEEMFDRVKPHHTSRHTTDKEGSFSFHRLQGGRYILAINLVNEERVTGSKAAAFPRIFYPGETSFQNTKAITLGDGKELKGLEFKLPVPPDPKLKSP